MRPAAPESPALRPIAPVFGRVTLPPFGPIRYGGPKPGALGSPGTAVIDDEAPSWATIEEPPLDELAPPAEPQPEPVEAEPVEAEPVAVEPEPLPIAALAEAEPVVEEFVEEVVEEPVAETLAEPEELVLPPQPEPEAPAWLDAEPSPEPEPRAWEPMVRRPVLPMTGPTDPTPIMNQTIERTTERVVDPHRMTPMRVTPLRPAAIPSPSAPTAEGNARAIAAALEMIAGRVRRGDLVVQGSMPTNDDPPALAAALAATLAALLGVRS